MAIHQILILYAQFIIDLIWSTTLNRATTFQGITMALKFSSNEQARNTFFTIHSGHKLTILTVVDGNEEVKIQQELCRRQHQI